MRESPRPALKAVAKVPAASGNRRVPGATPAVRTEIPAACFRGSFPFANQYRPDLGRRAHMRPAASAAIDTLDRHHAQRPRSPRFLSQPQIRGGVLKSDPSGRAWLTISAQRSSALSSWCVVKAEATSIVRRRPLPYENSPWGSGTTFRVPPIANAARCAAACDRSGAASQFHRESSPVVRAASRT